MRLNQSGNHSWIKRITAGLLTATLLWLAWTSISIWRFGTQDQAVPADCIIVLGAAIDGSEPSPVFAERIRHGINLYRQNVAKKLLFTGGSGEGQQYAESTVAAAFAMKTGVPAADILTENQSHTTLQNLAQAKALMNRNGLQSAIIVSDPLHMQRAMLMADDLGMKAVSSPTPTTRYRSWGKQWELLRRELYFLHHYWLFGE